MSSMTQ